MSHPSFLDWVVLALSALHLAGVLTVAREVWSGRTRLVCKGFSVAGIVALGSLLALTVTAGGLGIRHLAGLPSAGITSALLWIVVVLGLVRAVPGLVQLYEGWEIALRRRWQVPTRPMTEWVPGPDAPFITVQVPIHAEPPAVVIATLDALSRLDYPAYEVMVVDNNTTDEQLWRPVEQRCAELGFRFLYVEGIEGAKAGALNWSRSAIDPRTGLIALVDADYQVDRRWLRDIAGHFEDPTLGFVQCPHAHRELEQSAYRRMADAEHAWPQWSEMISRSEHGAGTTAGTMAMVRLTTLDQADGWAAWCLTEDSEFAIRAHTVGYRSIYVDQVYGWGLVPDPFEALKIQRYRWTYGPGQEFKRHLRLYLPGPWRRPSKLTPAQRWRHGNYGLTIGCLLALVVTAVIVPFSLGAVVLMLTFGWQAFQYSAAPVIAMIAERDLRHSQQQLGIRPQPGAYSKHAFGISGGPAA